MENFGKYLESKRIVSKKRVPFYVAWVSQVFKFVDKKSTEKITPKEVERLSIIEPHFHESYFVYYIIAVRINF